MLLRVMNIVICFDRAYLNPGLVWLYNLATVTPNSVLRRMKIHIGYPAMSLNSTHIEDIQKLCRELALNLNLYEISSIDDFHFGMNSELLVATKDAERETASSFKSHFLRFYFFYTLQEPFVYFDVDTLLLRDWQNIEIYQDYLLKSKKVLAAVRDPSCSFFSQDSLDCQPILKNGAFLSHSYNEYFKSGVFVFNPNYWSKIPFGEIVELWHTLKINGSRLYDQDVLNAMFAKDYLKIPDDYNFPATDPFMWIAAKRLSSQTPPKVLHFAGPAKPWLHDSSRKTDFMNSMLEDTPSKPFRYVFLKYYLVDFAFKAFRSLNYN